MLISNLLFLITMATMPFLADSSMAIPSQKDNPVSFLGSYQGMFSGSPITIFIDKVEAGAASGFSLHRQQKRALTGTYERMAQSTMYQFTLLEPGDGPYDGSFVLQIDSVLFSGHGSWVPKPGSHLQPISFVFAKEK